ncbi:ribbon-helix-helix protein, CopG family [Martelella mediterranea]|uniref:Ribbon-helix-helix CopG family protein n=1 Tax=Martelella mediterranea TaxID=293089 RepID=A0A4R3NCH4_9HYPH|nr:ribbon-helix-helix CopG family protein [Martelella mediterranea]
MPAPKRGNPPLTIRVSEELLKKIDNRRRDEDDIPTRPEMVRRILEAYFEE